MRAVVHERYVETERKIGNVVLTLSPMRLRSM
jgi:hypothetical protein